MRTVLIIINVARETRHVVGYVRGEKNERTNNGGAAVRIIL